MSSSDIFKKTFLEGFSAVVDAKHVLICLALACVMGLFVFLVYRIVSRKAFYSITFNISLIVSCIITCGIMLSVQSNIVLSLGMVGALSIVRFRTAVKDPLDLVFIYWAIGCGIMCGAGLTMICILVSLLVALVILVLRHYPVRKNSMLLVVNSTDENGAGPITAEVEKYCKNFSIRSKSVSENSLSMVVELNVPNDSDIVNAVRKVQGVTNVSLLTHDGDVTAV